MIAILRIGLVDYQQLADGTLVVASTGASIGTGGGGGSGSYGDNEVPAGAINGSNAIFTLAHAPSPAAGLQLFRNGVLQTAGGVDFTLSGTTITYVAAPQTGDTHVCSYRY